MNLLINADCRHIPLADNSVNCVVTSPPYYGLRDYGVSNQIGLEQTPDEYIANLVQVFREVKRVLRDDGTLWLNLGDSYASMKSRYNQKAQNLNGGKAQDNEFQGNKTDLYHHKELGLKDKDLIGIPWMAAFALRADGWWLRQDIIWAKPNPMPESVKDRCTKAHEYVFLLTKSARYYYDYEAVLEPATGYDGRKDTRFKGSEKYKDSGQTFAERGHERWPHSLTTGATGEPHSGYLNPDGSLRVQLKDGVPARNKRSVWTVATKPYKGAHFATFPPKLIEPMILAGCPKDGVVLDPFVGSGTTVMVANQLGRQGIGLDLNPKYLKLAQERIKEVQPILI